MYGPLGSGNIQLETVDTGVSLARVVHSHVASDFNTACRCLLQLRVLQLYSMSLHAKNSNYETSIERTGNDAIFPVTSK